MLLYSSATGAPLDRSTVPTQPNEREDPHKTLGLADPRPAVLPGLSPDKTPTPNKLTNAQGFFVRDINFSGATAVEAQTLSDLGAKFSGRNLTFADLQQLRDETTLLYVNRGFLTSGAIIGGLTNDILNVQVVEGKLTDIQIEPQTRYRTGYLNSYLEGFGPTSPVNVFNIEERLQILQAQRHIDRVEAQLLPGERQGESVLHLKPYDAEPLNILVEANNHMAPALGEGQVLATMDYLNLFGRSDDLHIGVRKAEGLKQLSTSYQLPINSRDTRLTIYAFGADSEIVASPFDELGIEAQSRTYGARIDQPLNRSLANKSTIYFTGEWRTSDTDLLGRGFSFVEGPDNGEVRIAVIRSGWEYTKRGANSVLAGRLQVSAGLNEFGSTSSTSTSEFSGEGGAKPQADFVTFLAQLQWAKRLPVWQSRLITRLDFQLANDPLFGLEQMPIGGRWSVRGYRENTLIRDSGAVASTEWRVPLDINAALIESLELGVFFDWSHSWNNSRDEVGPTKIYSAGLGLTWRPIKNAEIEAYWGHVFQDIDYPGNDKLQDAGYHLRLRWWNQ